MRTRATAALCLALVALAAGCGADDEGQPIPPRFAIALENRLDRVEQAMAQGSLEACQQALDIDVEVQRIVDSVPEDVDPEVRDALRRSFDRLFDLVGEQCNDRDQTETETTPTETETTPTETETTPTETETIPTETTTVPPTTPEPPPATVPGRLRRWRRRGARRRPMTVPTEVAGRYRIERRLGAGGMSTVFLATDTVLERAVAVKLLAEHLADDAAFVARFRREALAAARLQHPNVVQVFDSGQDAESRRHYIVMEYVDGPSCADLLREQKLLDIDDTVAIVRDACHGLDYAHRAGVVHRDVKPGNLLIAEEVHTTKIADFGIAKAAELTRITQVGSVLGTAAYLSPEQAHGEEAGPASDIYSLGVCTYQFLTGRLPHEYTSLTELALKQQQDPITPINELRPEVPPELDEAVRLALAREADGRYASALQFAQAIEAGRLGQSTDVTRTLALADTDATRAMQVEETAATRALRSRPRRSLPRRRERPAPVSRSERSRDDGRDRRKAERRRQLGTFLALLAILAAIGVVGLVLLTSTQDQVQPVDQSTVQDQIDGLRDFIREHSR